MKSLPFSVSTDGSNDQNLQKMDPLTAKCFDEDEHKLVTHFRTCVLVNQLKLRVCFSLSMGLWKSMKSHGRIVLHLVSSALQ